MLSDSKTKKAYVGALDAAHAEFLKPEHLKVMEQHACVMDGYPTQPLRRNGSRTGCTAGVVETFEVALCRIIGITQTMMGESVQ
jgi:hypothetical protein